MPAFKSYPEPAETSGAVPRLLWPLESIAKAEVEANGIGGAGTDRHALQLFNCARVQWPCVVEAESAKRQDHAQAGADGVHQVKKAG